MDPDTLLLEYSLGEERSYLWVVAQQSLKSHVLPKREQVEKVARRFYELLTTRSLFRSRESAAVKQQRIAQADSQLLEASAELSQMVLNSCFGAWNKAAGSSGRRRLAVRSVWGAPEVVSS